MDSETLKISTTTDGKPADPGTEKTGAPKEIDPATGQHKAYWVLSDEERKKGFTRPVRLSYIHTECNTETTMSKAIAETYARDPKYYNSTFCFHCRSHMPVSEFLWLDGTELGS